MDEHAHVVAMLQATDALVWAVDDDYRLLSSNDAFQTAQSAYSGRRLMPGDPVIHPDFPAERGLEWRGWYDRALKGERLSVNMRAEQGQRTIHHTAQLSPMYGPDGAICGVTVVSQDVTSHAETESALRHSEARFRTLTASSPLGVFLADKAGACVYANPRLCAIYDATEEDMLGSGYAARMHPDDMPQVMQRWQHARENGYDLDAEYRIVRADGSERYLHSRVAAVRESGELAGFVGTTDDETDRHAAAQRMRQSEKMESLGTLAGGIAHDFNNMLGVVLGFAELALLDAEGQPVITEKLDEIRTASLRARDLVRQILSFSRQSDRGRELVDLRGIAEESLRLLRATLPATLRVEATLTDEPLMVLGDATALQQIFVNLCTNAEYAMRGREHGVLDVSLAGDGPDDARAAVLRIADNGAGISEGLRNRLFEPFFTTKPAGEGTGMGLAVVHGIVRTHGGTISVDSVPARGSTFTVTIPLAAPAA
ncbi:MAG: ATP-binding protein [Gemmatimonadota bacterium]